MINISLKEIIISQKSTVSFLNNIFYNLNVTSAFVFALHICNSFRRFLEASPLLPTLFLNVEELADFTWSLPFYHVYYFIGSEIQQSLDVHVVCSQNKIQQSLLVNLHEFSIPLLDINIRGLFLVIGTGSFFRVLLAVYNDLAQCFATH